MGTQENKHFMNCLNERLQTKEEDIYSEPLVKATNKADLNFKVFFLLLYILSMYPLSRHPYEIFVFTVGCS